LVHFKRLDGEVGDGEEAVIGITLNLLCSLVYSVISEEEETRRSSFSVKH
jgi:hypothetical protein